MAPVARNPGVDELLAHAGWLGQLARHLAREDVAEDMVQETWVAALRSPPDGGRPPRPWLARVLFNFVRQHGRGETRRSRREDEARAAADTSTTEATDAVYQRLEQQRALAERVMALDEEDRRVVLLRFYDGRTSAEIARLMGIPAGTVRWRLKAALDRLRADLDRGPERDRWRAILAPGVMTMANKTILVPMAVATALVSLGGLGVVAWTVGGGTGGSGRVTGAAIASAAERRAPSTRSPSGERSAPVSTPAAPPTKPPGAKPAARRRLPASAVPSPPPDDPATRTRRARTLRSDEIRAVMRGLIPQVKECYATLMEEDPDAGRRVLVKLVIKEVEGKGRISEASIMPKGHLPDGWNIAPSELDAPRTKQCVLDAVAGAEFPAGDATFAYPFLLSPP